MKKAVIIGMIFLALAGCKSQKEVTTNSHVERISIDRKELTLPAFNLRVDYPCFPEELRIDTIIKVDPRTGAELRVWRNKYNEMVAECEGQDTVIIYRSVDKEISTDKSMVNITEKTGTGGFFARFGAAIKWFLIGAVTMFIVLFLLKLTRSITVI